MAEQDTNDDTGADGALLGGGAGDGGAQPSGAATDTGGEGGALPSAAAEPSADKPWFSDDWRERMVAKLPAEERTKELARLKRFASPENVYSSNRTLEKRLSSGGLKPTLPENPSPEEVAAYRKANGIPESADGYGLTFPDGVEAGESDKAELATFLADMHAANVPPGQVKVAFDAFLKIQGEAAQRRHDAAKESTINARAELRSEYGRDFSRNMTVANNFLNEHGGDDVKGLLGSRLADGTTLGDNPTFVRMIVNAALATSGDEALIVSDLSAGGKSLDDQRAEMIEMSVKEPKKYHTDEMQAKVSKIYAAIEQRDARRGHAA